VVIMESRSIAGRGGEGHRFHPRHRWSTVHAMSDELTIILEGGMRELKEHREVLASQGIASRIIAPPGSGKG